MKADIFVFGGTKEGRLLCEYIKKTDKTAVVYVATEYGESLLEETERLKVAVGRLDQEQMVRQMKHYAPKLVIDGTHPYAKEVTRNIEKACQEANCPYIRIKRQEEGSCHEGIYWAEDSKEAADYLKEKEGNILLTTGSKELEEFVAIPFFKHFYNFIHNICIIFSVH